MNYSGPLHRRFAKVEKKHVFGSLRLPPVWVLLCDSLSEMQLIPLTYITSFMSNLVVFSMHLREFDDIPFSVFFGVSMGY
jgi:hypothetical protein